MKELLLPKIFVTKDFSHVAMKIACPTIAKIVSKIDNMNSIFPKMMGQFHL